MFDSISRIFSAEGYPPRWSCGPGWKDSPEWGWALIVSDIAIWGAYLAIPAVIVFFLKQRRDLPFPRILWLFVAFIFACGTTHLVDAMIFWWPAYRFLAILKFLTAVVSWVTVAALVPLIPKLLQFRGPEALELEIDRRTRQLQSALKAGRMGAWEWNLTTDIIEIDQAEQLLTGLNASNNQVTLQEFMAVVYPDDVEGLRKAISMTIQGNGVYQHEFRIRLPNREIRWLGGRGEVFRGGNGKPEAFCGVNFDLTELKATESVIRENQERFQTIADNIAQFAWMTDSTGNIEWYNKRWFEYTGTTLEKMRGWGWQEVHHPDHVDRVVKRIKQSFADGTDWEDTFPLRGHDGAYRWFLSRAKAIKNNDGQVVRWFGTNTDVTEHLERERTLRIQTRAIEFATNGILITDARRPDMPIIYANHAFETLTGYSIAEVVGRNCRFLQGPDTNDEQRGSIREAVRNKTECHVTILNFRKDGTSFWNDLHIAPVEDETGIVSHFIGVQSDISDRIQFEISLQELRLKADSANKAKSEFLANMSHEIRTPLTAILGCAETLYRQTQDVDSRDVSRMIRDQGQLLLGILNDVLDLSKIDAGRLEIHRERCELVRIISNIESLMRPLATERGLQLEVEYRTLVPEEFETAPLRLRQIMLNLVSNAIKFTESGSIHISISCDVVGSEGTLVVDVLDTGIGISKDRLDSVFEPFVQETHQRKWTTSGTGLGLTISRRLAVMLGGTISVQSELQRGSCFTLKIPISGITSTALRSAHELLGMAKTRDSSVELDLFIPARVLIAEDSRAIQFMMRRLLESFVGSVTVVEDGKAAVDAVRQAIQDRKPFNIIFMDIQMPVMNGYEATKQLRALGINTPVIALTAGAMSGERENCLSIGCTDYLPKPVHRDDLVNAVQRYGQPSRLSEA